jgi:hypothetical protein
VRKKAKGEEKRAAIIAVLVDLGEGGRGGADFSDSDKATF